MIEKFTIYAVEDDDDPADSSVVAIASMCLGHFSTEAGIVPAVTMVTVNALPGGGRVLVEAVASLPH
jgi:hypothetical protein